MANPLFQMLGGGTPNDGGFSQMLQQFNQFRQSFQGDPKAEVQRLLNSGEMSQEQFNQLQGMANQFMSLMGGNKG